MTENIKGLAELHTHVTALFGDLDQNITEIEQRIQELQKALASRGTDSLAAVQQNLQDQTELDQVKAARSKLQQKRADLASANSGVLYQQMDAIASTYFAEKAVEREKNEVAEIRAHWQKIKELDEKIKADSQKEALQVNEALNPYLNFLEGEAKNRAAAGFGMYRGFSTPYADRIKSGTFY